MVRHQNPEHRSCFITSSTTASSRPKSAEGPTTLRKEQHYHQLVIFFAYSSNLHKLNHGKYCVHLNIHSVVRTQPIIYLSGHQKRCIPMLAVFKSNRSCHMSASQCRARQTSKRTRTVLSTPDSSAAASHQQHASRGHLSKL